MSFKPFKALIHISKTQSRVLLKTYSSKTGNVDISLHYLKDVHCRRAVTFKVTLLYRHCGPNLFPLSSPC